MLRKIGNDCTNFSRSIQQNFILNAKIYKYINVHVVQRQVIRHHTEHSTVTLPCVTTVKTRNKLPPNPKMWPH